MFGFSNHLLVHPVMAGDACIQPAPRRGHCDPMNATQLALLALTIALLVSAPVQADGNETEEDPCPAIQTMLHEPYVSIQPNCIGDTLNWTLRQV